MKSSIQIAIITAVSASPLIAQAQIGLDFLNLPPGAEIGDVLSRLYVYGVGVVAIAAMIMLVFGGVQYMVAGEKDPGPAKERIRNAIWGLILALCSWLILYTINPDLTKKVILVPLDIDRVAPPTPGTTPPGGCTLNEECGGGFLCSIPPGRINGVCVPHLPGPTRAERQTRCRAHTQQAPCDTDTMNQCEWLTGIMVSACNTTAP